MDNRLIGRLGELLVEQQLITRNWHPVRLDTAQLASNADLVAIKEMQRVSLQVKTTNNEKSPHAPVLTFGFSTGYLSHHKPVFNSKPSPLMADIIVGVSYAATSPRFVVLPVALAEKLCREKCDLWNSTPKKDGTKHSPSFPIKFFLTKRGGAFARFDGKMTEILLSFEDRWDLLSKPIDRFHDDKTDWSLQTLSP